MVPGAQLVSRSCTTGWADWVHGELWLLPHLLVRRRLGLAATFANGVGPTVPSPAPVVEAWSLDLGAIAAAHRTNVVLALPEVATAVLHSGLATDRLALTMRDGSRHKLLWLHSDPAHHLLAGPLRWALGPRFAQD